jgi:hypothetical protein
MIIHYSEHIIKLFALGSKTVEPGEEQFLEHLETCENCRKLYDEMHKLLRGLDEMEIIDKSKNEKSPELILPQGIKKPRHKLIYNIFPRPASVKNTIRKPAFISMGILSIVILLITFLNSENLFHLKKDNIINLQKEPALLTVEKKPESEKPVLNNDIAYKSDKSGQDENKYYKDLLNGVEKQFRYRSVITDFTGIKKIVESPEFNELLNRQKNKNFNRQDTVKTIIQIIKIEH